MVTSGEATPLWISPLVHHPTNDDSGQYSYQVLQRLVTSSPNPDHLETEIETALEAYIGPEGDVLWRRVVVRSGSSSPHQVIHSSFSLPNEAPVESDSVLCWAAFPERPNHKLLCVLASPTLLCIWDVYPSVDSDLGGEGHSIPLPFEATAIYAIGDKHGLLLQRKDSVEDRLAYDIQNKTWTMSGIQDADDDDDGFILKAPPRPVRLQGDMTGATSIGGLPVSTSSNSVPSLFSLAHPLDDVLPISLLADDSIQPAGTITDVFEKVLFVGMLRWTDPNEDILDRREYTQPICVTYHTQRKRHAIWEIKSAPPPPPQAPLWQVSGQWRSDNGWNSHLGVLQQDLEDLELLGTSEEVDSSHYDSTTRNEALADALGVRKTPRKAVEDMAPRSRSVTARSKQRIASNNNSLLSPLSRALNDTHVHMQPETTTVEYTGGKGSAPPLLTLGPFSSLHPTIAMTCLYEESKMSSQAVDVFLASNLEGSGTLVVCLVCPVDGQTNPNELKLYSFDSNGAQVEQKTSTDASGDLIESFGRCFAVNNIPATPCVSAQPVQTTPIPPCFRPHQRNDKGNRKELAEDILLLRRNEFDVTALALYRADMHIVDCALPMIDDTFQRSGNTSDVLPAFVASIGNAVNNHVDLVCFDGLQQEIRVRGRVSLMMSSNALCEKTLQAVDAAMFNAGEEPSDRKAIEVALKLRADCVRMEQALSKGEQGQSPLFEDTHCSAVETALSAIFEFDLLGVNPNQEKLQNERGENTEGSAWESLLQSEFHQLYSAEYSELLDGIGDATVPSSAALAGQDLFSLLRRQLASIHSLSLHCMASCHRSFSNRIFDALHFLYEDFKLCCDSKGAAGLRFLGSVLGRACLTVTKASPPDKNEVNLFLEHYRRDLGEHWLARLKSSCEKAIADYSSRQRSEEGITAYSSPPCILSRIDGLISGEVAGGFYNDCDLSSINAACSRTRTLIRILSMLFLSTDDYVGMSEEKKDVERHRDHAIVTALIEEGFTDPAVIRDELPAGIALPLLEVLHRCRGDPAMVDVSDLDALAWSLVGREDLRKNIETISPRFLEKHKGAHRLASSHDTDSSQNENTQFEDKDKDGTVPLEFTSSMLFPNDNRIREVGRMLRSSRPTFLSVPRAIEVSDHDFERMKQEKLLLLSRRVLALPVGRGMLTIGNLQPVPAESLPLPDLCLTGRVPPINAMLALDITDCPTDLRVWPEFHNGVAAGLRLPLGEDADEIVSKITRTWIVYNRPQRNSEPQSQNNPNTPNPSQNLSHCHGGLLMALGLRGHLTNLEMTDLFDYLTQGTVTTTVGVLLGMAANMRGSCDISVSKMLCLHIPSLIPHHFSSIDVASPVQAAAVAGTGLLYQGSSHRMITEFLLNEIGKRPASDVNAFDREAYTLSCGISLGMVNLCQGERINGDVEGSGSAGLADLRIEERLYRYVVGGIDDIEMRRRKEENDRLSVPSSSAANSNEKCSCVLEGESINTDITAPGATLALGLIYMKSGNKTIASAIALPDTHFLLEYVRPDFLMLRVIARALILWNDVKPSKDWIESQLPPVVRKAYRQMGDAAKKASGFTGLSNFSQTYDESNAMDTQNPVDEERLKQNPNISSSQQNQDFDRQAVRQIYAHVIAGACFGIGLRFAGTGDSEASAAIFDRVMELQVLRDSNDPVSAALRPAGPVLEMCLGCAAMSLAMVMAGSGDLDTLKLLKTLRWRCEEDVNYGTHMTYGAAIGLLFLGGGTCTLGREPQDIATLVMSFYPRYPSTTSDNQYHLQALRNLYAIAVKQRELRAVDVDTGESVFVPIEIHFSNKSASPLHLNAPCLLYNTDEEPKELRVVSDRYYPLTLNIGSPPLGRTFFVKKRSAHLSYRQDPDSDRSLLVQTGSFRGGAFLDIVGSFTEDPRVLAFAQYFCDVGDAHSNQGSHPFSVAGFCTRVLHECLTLDTEEALPFYLALRSVISAVKEDSSAAVRFVWDFRLIRSYYERRQNIIANSSTRLLNEELVTYLCGLLENTLIESASGRNGNTSGRSLGPTSAYFDVPLDTDLSSEMNLQVTDSMDVSL